MKYEQIMTMFSCYIDFLYCIYFIDFISLPFLTSALLSGVSAIAISSGMNHVCVIVSQAGGSVKCWGWNDYGQLGIGSTGNRYSPLDVPGE